jgi:hypothetical protein
MRVGTVTDHFAASKADYEGGDYSPEAEAAVRAYERNRAELARQGTFSLAPVSNGSRASSHSACCMPAAPSIIGRDDSALCSPFAPLAHKWPRSPYFTAAARRSQG